jgi:putative nucleotidyltransferase with HDIG domain
MLRRPVGEWSVPLWLTKTVLVLTSIFLFAGVVASVVVGPGDRVTSLTAVLAIAAIVSGIMVPGPGRGEPAVSATFIVLVLAAAFLGPASACAAVIISELASSARLKTPLRTIVLINLPAGLIPAAAIGLLIRALVNPPTDTVGFYLVLGLAASAAYALSFVVFASCRRALRPNAPPVGLGEFTESLPGAGLSVLLVLAGASIYLKVGLRGIAFALAAVFAFSYMSHLLQRARHRSEQYVSLSWGVLAGLMRSLDIRDQRAARHAAAVARFASDIARQLGMSDQRCELAHTAGLLHDIGHFALSDRVAERGRTLTDEDWTAIQRHPELGADMLKDLGMYGPVGEIVLAHHERIDGRGYPQGLTGEQIPKIAKIISVAEVYDTLTASDTYRTRMSSFEALRELRRVSGSQLDGDYVEVLAQLLSGEGVEYRHADAADFDTELAMERRIKEAGAG